MLKSNIRKKFLKIRKLNFSENRKIKFNRIIKIINNFNKKKLILGGYYPVNFEIDCLQILSNLEKKKYEISLPVIKKNNQMDFYLYSFSDPLNLNKYGIPEPQPQKKNIVFPDILFVPMVAFDCNLLRLGYGGGYYDRYIEKLNKKKSFLSVGLAFDSQKMKKIPFDKFDKSLDIIITEKKIYK